ncbi:hypothetical protein LTR85_006694 [Meristemomyces frigidus]|nr:hypothetical protein LTR85_006694 [Meristemomyces frigidus]
MSDQPFRWVELPAELRIQILGYLLKTGNTVTVNDDRVSTNRRRWNQELAGLSGIRWKPAKADPTPVILRVSPDVAWDGMAAYWGGNSFAFGRRDLLQWFIEDCPRPAKEIKSIILGEDYHVDKSGQQVPCSGWIKGDHVPSLELLKVLEKLLKVETIFHGLDLQPYAQQKHQEAIWGKKMIDMPECLRHPNNDKLALYYARDIMLMTIPKTILDRLTSLTIRYPVWHRELSGLQGVMKVIDVLQYARDLQRRAWRTCPFETRDQGSGRWVATNAEKRKTALLWREARAAVYWEDVVSEGTTHGQVRRPQWCTWSVEWLEVDELRVPRTWEELFDEDDKVRAEWHSVSPALQR